MKVLAIAVIAGLVGLAGCGSNPGASTSDVATPAAKSDADGVGGDSANDMAATATQADAGPVVPDAQAVADVDAADGPGDLDADPIDVAGPDGNGTAPDVPLDAGPNQDCLSGQFKAGTTCQAANCETVGIYETSQLNALVFDHQTCTQDADCAIVDVSTRCYPKCPYGIQKEYVAAAEAFAADFDAAVCIPFDVSEVCKTKEIVLKCSPASPGCVKGYCAADKQYESNDCASPAPKGAKCFGGKWICDPGLTLPPHVVDCIPATCDEIQGALQDAVAKVMAGPSTDCVQDLDCAPLVLGTACGTLCTAAVNKSASKSAGAFVSEWDTYCKEVSFPANCVVPPIPTCPAKSLACMAGKCVFAKP